jgi:hypothetical protein
VGGKGEGMLTKKNLHWIQMVSEARPSILKASHQAALHKRNALITITGFQEPLPEYITAFNCINFNP